MTEKELRELDAFCAEHVMEYSAGIDADGNDVWYYDQGKSILMELWQPTVAPEDAMEVLKRCMVKTRTTLSTDTFEGNAVYNHERDTVGTAETLELAIVLFAKKIFSK